MKVIKQITLFLFVIAFADFIAAQGPIEFNIGPPLEYPSNNVITSLFVKDSSHYYILRLGNKACFDCKSGNIDAYFEKFDKNLQHTESIPIKIDPSYQLRKPLPKKIFLVNNHIYVFADEVFYASKSTRSYLLMFDMNGRLVKDPLLLGEIHKINIPSNNVFESEPNDFFSLSLYETNSSSQFLYTQSFPPGGSDKTTINIKVFNTDFTSVWEKQLSLPSPSDYTEFSQIILNGEEVFFILSFHPPLEDKIYYLVTYNNITDHLAYYDFNFEDKKIEEISVKMLESEAISIIGLFSEPEEDNLISGMFFFLFDKENQTLSARGSSPIKTGQFKTITKKDLINLHTEKMHQRANGDVVYLAELKKQEFNTFTDSEGKFHLSSYYHSNDIKIMYFKNDGSLQWQIWIPKKQYLVEPELLGFFDLIINETLFIIYNDSKKNLYVHDPDRIKKMSNKFVLTVALVDLETGEYSKRLLTQNENRKGAFVFKKAYTYYTGKNSLIMVDYKNGLRLAKITF